ncbi:tyrosine-type recombinase/integrase [Brevundimonas sp.]|uniref:tyrosine-type recombinase/integrase n=1 Tax=Brevundimonas sp. TaxID=1871086 RepID=UPI003569E57F
MAGAVGLTDAKIRGLQAPDAGRIEVADKVVSGLRIRVGTSGAKTFILRKRIGGRIANVTVGRFHDQRFTLTDARKKARTLLNDIEGGGDPRGETRRMTGGGAGTIRALFDDYKRAKAGKRSSSEVERIFNKYVLPEIGDRLADSVSRAEVTRLIDGVAAGGSRPTPVMARAVAAQLSAFYSWAMPRLHRLEVNPCRDAGKPDKPKARERVLSNGELKALWTVLEGEGLPWGPSVKLLVLTGQRRDEVFSADRAEFDLEAKLWTIPADRAKNGKAHLVPLSNAAVAILEAVPVIDGSAKLFPSRADPERGASGFSRALARITADMVKELTGDAKEPAIIDHFTLHDLRRTMATGLQRLGVRLEVTEAALNHISGTRGGLAGVYQRHDFLDEKRHALDAWAAEVGRIVTSNGCSEVAKLHA